VLVASECDAYLDIETTGLSREYAGITVVGVYLVNGADSRLVQLVGIDGGMPLFCLGR